MDRRQSNPACVVIKFVYEVGLTPGNGAQVNSLSNQYQKQANPKQQFLRKPLAGLDSLYRCY